MEVNKQAYKAGTTLPQIVEDGFVRGFRPEQTMREARGMGFVATEEWIEAHWRTMQCDLIDPQTNNFREQTHV